MSFKLGMNAKLYYGTAGAIIGALTELGNVKDVTIDHVTGESDVTTRANQGFKAIASVLRECTVTFKMQQQDNDAALTAIEAAWLAGTNLEFVILTGARNILDSEGPKGTFSITNFSRGEALTEAITYDVTAKLQTWDCWYVRGAALYTMTGTMNPDIQGSYYNNNVTYNTKNTYCNSDFTYFVWFTGTNWRISTAVGVNGAAYFQKLGVSTAGNYSSQGTATGTGTLVAI